MNKKTLMLLGLTVFLLIPILLVYGADKPVNPDDTFGLVESGDLVALNPAPGDSIGLTDNSGLHPHNPDPRSNIISISGLAYYEGIYYTGGVGDVPGTYTPPKVISNLMSFILPLALMLAIGGFGVALVRNRSYRCLELNHYK